MKNSNNCISEQLLNHLGISTERLSKAVITLEPGEPLKVLAEYIPANDISIVDIKKFELVEK